MKINIKPSFERIYKKLSHTEKTQVDGKIHELFNFYNGDMLFARLSRIRKMGGKDNYFEIDTASNRRILVRKQKNIIELIAYGNHDEIKKFLKQA